MQLASTHQIADPEFKDSQPEKLFGKLLFFLDHPMKGAQQF